MLTDLDIQQYDCNHRWEPVRTNDGKVFLYRCPKCDAQRRVRA